MPYVSNVEAALRKVLEKSGGSWRQKNYYDQRQHVHVAGLVPARRHLLMETQVPVTQNLKIERLETVGHPSFCTCSLLSLFEFWL